MFCTFDLLVKCSASFSFNSFTSAASVQTVSPQKNALFEQTLFWFIFSAPNKKINQEDSDGCKTYLRMSVDLHLLSEVNFDRVGPELGPLLWSDEGWLWALGMEQYISTEQLVTDSLNLCSDFLEERWAINHSVKGASISTAAEEGLRGRASYLLIYRSIMQTHTWAQRRNLTLTCWRSDLKAAVGLMCQLSGWRRSGNLIVESFTSRAKKLFFLLTVWTLQLSSNDSDCRGFCLH